MAVDALGRLFLAPNTAFFLETRLEFYPGNISIKLVSRFSENEGF